MMGDNFFFLGRSKTRTDKYVPVIVSAPLLQILAKLDLCAVDRNYLTAPTPRLLAVPSVGVLCCSIFDSYLTFSPLSCIS